MCNASFLCWPAPPAWTGGIANQNRGTLGGNIVNASPAADSLPALLAYEAELILVSVRGERRVPYREFHTGYKKTKLAPDELIRTICIRPEILCIFCLHPQSRSAQRAGDFQSLHRGTGASRRGGVVEDVRIALGSVAPVPIRLVETERLVLGKPIEPSLLASAKKTAIAEIRPIDDIRSTARYRSAVVGNLVAEFLQKLGSRRDSDMSAVLARWNASFEWRRGEGNPAVLRLESLGWRDGSAKAVSGRHHSASSVRRNLE